MVFSSNVFLFLFLPLVLSIYFLAPGKIKNLVLLISSLVFYSWGEPVYIFIMLFSTVFDYANGLLLEYFDKKNQPNRCKTVLVLSVLINIGLLSFFKYTDFVIGSIDSVSSLGLAAWNIALPVGISFYTFQTLSYTIDVYRRRVKAQHNIVDFGMYISMFPQLIAGPIVKYADIAHQLKNRPQDPDMICKGIFRFIIGLAKKVVIANQAGAIWDEIKAMNGQMSALTAWIGAIAFALQIYFDFSGYSDMAIGLGKMFGFNLPENFDHPYESKSITEFWRRWHMTLGAWFRDYLYIPLGGNKKGIPRQIFNLLLVWFLTGLWHGAGWNFILWGLYFFVFLIIEKFLLKNVPERVPVLSHIYTLLVVVLSWVIFACNDFGLLANYMKALFGAGGLADPAGIYLLGSNPVILLLGVVGSTSLIKRSCTAIAEKIEKGNLLMGIKALTGIVLYLLSIALIISDKYNPFLYFRF